MIWKYFLDECCNEPKVTLSDNIRMTRTAWAYGCDVSERIKRHCGAPDPLFELDSSYLFDRRGRVLPDGIRFVLDIGYELEERNSDGLTPLLYAASGFSNTTVRILQALIGEKANLCATAPDGKNSLQIAQAPFWLMKSWQTLELSDDGTSMADSDDDSHEIFNWCRYVYRTDCIVLEEDFDEEPFDLMESDHSLLKRSDVSDLRHGYHPGTPPSAYMEIEEVSMLGCASMLGNSSVDLDDELGDLHEIPLGHPCSRAEHYTCHPECSIDLSSWRIYVEKDGTMRAIDLSGGYDVDLVPNILDCGCTTLIRNPIPILKRRMRFKLLTLLRAGCDPNHLDEDGQSPSDDVRKHNIWPEWTWALLKSGYVYNDDPERWVKSSTSA